jgi:hypothetical protein
MRKKSQVCISAIQTFRIDLTKGQIKTKGWSSAREFPTAAPLPWGQCSQNGKAILGAFSVDLTEGQINPNALAQSFVKV